MTMVMKLPHAIGGMFQNPHQLAKILLGHRNHETQVGLHQLVQGSLVSHFNPLSKSSFFFRSNHRNFRYLLEILLYRLRIPVRNLGSNFKLPHNCVFLF